MANQFYSQVLFEIQHYVTRQHGCLNHHHSATNIQSQALPEFHKFIAHAGMPFDFMALEL